MSEKAEAKAEAKKKVKVGIIGCGNISGQYLKNAPHFPVMEVVALADLEMDKAQKAGDLARAAMAKKANPQLTDEQALDEGRKLAGPRVCTVRQLLKDDSIELVLNLTIPKAHVPVAVQCLKAGKHTYAEKPLGLDRKEGRKLMELAAKKNLLVGCAPDTFMGAGIQTARKLIDDGAIGRPLAFTAFMMCRGHESWHPSPEFYYEVGGGPMFDMGPYYLTALLNILGPVKQITGATSIAIPERTITSKPKFGQKMIVQTPDHICGTMQFENGVVGTIITTFATRYATYDGKQPITIYGTDGTLKVPDPNAFDGPVQMRKEGDADWQEVPHAFVKGYGRAVGLADMAYAIRSGRKHRASGQQAMAVLDLMQGFLDSGAKGKAFTPGVPFERPAAMPANLPFGTLDE